MLYIRQFVCLVSEMRMLLIVSVSSPPRVAPLTFLHYNVISKLSDVVRYDIDTINCSVIVCFE